MGAQEARSAAGMNRGDFPFNPLLEPGIISPWWGGGWALRDEKGKGRRQAVIKPEAL